MTGSQLVQLAAKKRGQKYVLGARAPLSDPAYSGPWDCAEFVSWAAYQATGQKIGCTESGDPYTGAWAAIKPTIPLEQAYKTPGAVLVRKPRPGHMGHVALSDGKGGTIEAHSKALGVGQFAGAAQREWTSAVLIPGVEYGEEKKV